MFLALKKYGKDWGKVQQYVGSRSSTQARSHAQKFFQKFEKGKDLIITNIDLLLHGDVIKHLREAEDGKANHYYDFEDSADEDEEDFKSEPSNGKRER